MTDAVSDIISLIGVPGRFIDAILACLDRNLSTVEIWGNGGAEAADKGGGISVFGVGTTRKVLGATVRLIGDPVAAAAGLAGTDVVEVTGVARVLLTWASAFCELVAGDCSFAGLWLAAVISNFPGGCRLVEATGVATGADVSSLVSNADTFVAFFWGLVSWLEAFFLGAFPLTDSFTGVSGVGFFSSAFGCCFFWTGVTSAALGVDTPTVGVFTVLALPVTLVGVSGATLTWVVITGGASAGCFVFLFLAGVTGTTGTAGVIVDEVVLDIDREPGRDFDSSTIARGIAVAEKPGGIVGVARRGCVKKWLLIGVLGILRIGSSSGSASLTRASTLNEACSSALKVASSVHSCQLNDFYTLVGTMIVLFSRQQLQLQRSPDGFQQRVASRV